MSLVIADCYKDNMLILSDAKITSDGGYRGIEDKEVWRNVEKYGCIKTYLLSDSISVSFAGDWAFMNQFMEWLIEVGPQGLTIEDLLIKLVALNIKSNGNTDFLLCHLHPKESFAFKVQDGKCEQVPNGWIGDYEAFRLYQKEKLQLQSKLQNVSSREELSNIYAKAFRVDSKAKGVAGMFAESTSTAMNTDIEYNKWYIARYIAFSKVVDSPIIPTVGKFVTKVLTNDQRQFFVPSGYQTVTKLPSHINFFKGKTTYRFPVSGDSRNGDFSYVIAPIVGSRLQVLIAEGNFAINYDAGQYPNSSVNHLFLPKIYKLPQDYSLAESITFDEKGHIQINPRQI